MSALPAPVLSSAAPSTATGTVPAAVSVTSWATWATAFGPGTSATACLASSAVSVSAVDVAFASVEAAPAAGVVDNALTSVETVVRPDGISGVRNPGNLSSTDDGSRGKSGGVMGEIHIQVK